MDRNLELESRDDCDASLFEASGRASAAFGQVARIDSEPRASRRATSVTEDITNFDGSHQSSLGFTVPMLRHSNFDGKRHPLIEGAAAIKDFFTKGLKL